jgi:hypothetical protein
MHNTISRRFSASVKARKKPHQDFASGRIEPGELGIRRVVLAICTLLSQTSFMAPMKRMRIALADAQETVFNADENFAGTR